MPTSSARMEGTFETKKINRLKALFSFTSRESFFQDIHFPFKTILIRNYLPQKASENKHY
jgi:hypothetical protein